MSPRPLLLAAWLILLAPHAAAADLDLDHPIVSGRAARFEATVGAPRWSSRHAVVGVVRDAVRERGLPAELAAIPLVESGYRNVGPDANPYADTSGLWQFTPDTARAYGLVVTGETDERRDLDLATHAALSYLEDLHAELGAWGLAIAAYNTGPHRVRRAVAAHGTRDALELVDRGALPPYVADVLAAAAAMRDAGLIER